MFPNCCCVTGVLNVQHNKPQSVYLLWKCKIILESLMLLHWYLRYSCLYKQSNTKWHLELSVTVSQDVSVHLATHAHMVVLNQPSVALALFSRCLDSPHVTGARQVIKIPLDLCSSNCTQIKFICVIIKLTHHDAQVSIVWRDHLCRLHARWVV